MNSGVQHSIRKQTIELYADSEETAISLQSRVSEINRNKLLPVIERVMARISPLDRHIQIDKLSIDLGWLSFHEFENTLEQRLESVLSRELTNTLNDFSEMNKEGQLIHNTRIGNYNGNGGNGVRIYDNRDSRLRLLEHYLVNGSLPWYAHGRSTFSFETLFLELVNSDSDSLIALIKKNSHLTQVLSRLVFQLQQSSLNQLLHLLEPKYGALIISYLIDLNTIYVVKPLLVLELQLFNRLLWILALNYSVNERGSQFNRRSFIKSLLKGMAQSERLQYSDLLQILSLGMRPATKNKSLRSSLPALIAKLVEEQQRLDDKGNYGGDKVAFNEPLYFLPKSPDKENIIVSTMARIEYYLCTGLYSGKVSNDNEQQKLNILELIELIRLSDSAASTFCMALIRELAKRSGPGLSMLIERLLRVFTTSDLLNILVAKDKNLIETWINTLIGSCNQLLAIQSKPKKSSHRLVWHAVLQYLITETSNTWQVQSMISQSTFLVAEKIGTAPVTFASQLKVLLDDKVDTTIKSALQMVIVRMDNNFERRHKIDPEIKNSQLLSPEQAKHVLQFYDNIESIRYFLHFGVLPWQILQFQPELSEKVILAGLLRLSETRLRLILRFENKNTQNISLHKVCTLLPENSLLKLIGLILPQGSPEKEKFRESVAASASNAKNKEAFYVHLIAGLLHNRQLDFEAFENLEPLPVNTELTYSIERWDRHKLQSEFISRLHHAQQFESILPSSTEILNELITRYSADTKVLILTLYDTPNLVDEMTVQIEPSTFTRLLTLLQPNDHSILQALMESLQTIPVPYRPDINLLRQIILNEAVSLEHPIGEGFFIRVLDRLFQGSLSGPLRNHLLKSVELWSEAEKLPISVISSYHLAINRHLGEPGAEQALNSGSPSSPSSLADILKSDSTRILSTQQLDLQQQVFSFLSGRSFTDDRDGLQQDCNINSMSKHQRQCLIIKLFDQSPKTLSIFIKQHLVEEKTREFWVSNLSESLLARIILLLEPQQSTPLLENAEVLSVALFRTTPGSNSRLEVRNDFWRFMLYFFAHNKTTNCNLKTMTIDFFNYFSDYTIAQNEIPNKLSTKHQNSQDLMQEVSIEALIKCAIFLAQKSGKNRLGEILQQEKYLLAKSWKKEKPGKDQKETGKAMILADKRRVISRYKSMEQVNTDGLNVCDPIYRSENNYKGPNSYKDETNYNGESIYIDNAGLILVGVFLPHLFKSLDMLDTSQDGKVKLRDPTAFNRGVHILQYLVDGSTSTSEPALALNKILCGESPATAVELMIELRESEIEISEQLLQAMLTRWDSLSNTSVGGLQQTFLQREGRLEQNDDGWKLTVQRKTVDVLVDQVPWRTSIISEAWMPQPIFVSW